MPDKTPVWLVTRYEDVNALLKDERFSKNRRWLLLHIRVLAGIAYRFAHCNGRVKLEYGKKYVLPEMRGR